MLTPARSYDELISGFKWDIPKQYNMGVDTCDKWADRDANRTAIIELIDGGRKDVSFGKLKDMSNAMAIHLRALGVVKGDRVGVLRSQSAWTAASHIAIWKIGAISVPLFTLFRAEALMSRLKDAAVKIVISDLNAISLVEPLRAGLPDLEHLVIAEEIDGNNGGDFRPCMTNPDDPAVLIYTSGTTGAPKGALHGHRVLLGHLPGVEMSHNFLPQQGDCLWTPADWAWIGGLFDVLMPGLHHGVPVVAARMQKFSAKGMQDIITDAGVRNVFMPPTALKILKSEGVMIENLRSVASGGEPLGAELLDWGREHLGLTINEFYGQTECNMVLSSCAELFEPQNNCIGRVVPGHDVAVIDQTGNRTLGEGDIAVHKDTPVMMLGYWQNPDATAEKFRGDWMLTGDRGVVDGDFIRFVAREDDVITSSGYRIGPSAIENCLLGHPKVVAAAVVGKADLKRTEIVKAYVMLDDAATACDQLVKELQSHVADNLAAHEYPREIEFISDFPMTVTGKIIRKELKQRANNERPL